jgi:hypothetical protein
MYSSEKGFLEPKKVLEKFRVGKTLVKQVLTPPFVAMPDHPHQLPRSVQRKRARPARQLKPRFFRSSVALAVVAPVAARYQIFP